MYSLYATHSQVTDPAEFGSLLDALPTDHAAVAKIAQGLVYHYFAGQYMFGYAPPKERMGEIDTRTISRMLARMLELDDQPLEHRRDVDKRIVGCCRDFSLIACAILRQHAIPARLRYGFAAYFSPGYWEDHVIVEAWTGSRWQRFDPQLAGLWQTDVDLLDIPDTAFVTGGRAWLMCREQGVDVARFGLGPHVPEVSGWWFIRGRLQLDVAALHKAELLCWDEWNYGKMGAELTEEDNEFLDQVAALAQTDDLAPLTALWQHDERLKLPAAVTCFSPVRGPHPVSI